MSTLQTCAGLLLGAAVATASAQTLPPIRTLPAPLATSSIEFRAASNIRVLSDGRVLVNESGAQRLLLLDAALGSFKLIADSTAATKFAYRIPAGRIFGGLGDTTYFLVTGSQSLDVIAPDGSMDRARAFPPGADGRGFGTARIDPRGRLVYRGNSLYGTGRGGPNEAVPARVDSFALVRSDFHTRTADTIAYLGGWIEALVPYMTAEGFNTKRRVVDPTNKGDDWTMLSDGTIAVLRPFPFHIEWIDIDGKRTETPPLLPGSYSLTALQKVFAVDSARVFFATHQVQYSGRAGGINAPVVSGRYSDSVVAPHEVSNQTSAFFAGGTIADADNHLWIAPAPLYIPSASAPRVYHVLDRTGRVVDRIQIGADEIIAGFSPGFVYLSVKSPGGRRLARVKLW